MTETGKRKSAPTGGGATQHQSKKKKTGNAGKWKTPHQQAKAAARQQEGAGVQPGDAGIWITCARHQESKAAREIEVLFSEYAEKMYGIKGVHDTEEDGEDGDNDDDDIEAAIRREVAALTSKKRINTNNGHDLTPLKMNVDCLLFVKTRAPIDPVAFVRRVCEDARAAAYAADRPGLMMMRCRYVNRLTPVTATGKATEQGLVEVARKVLAPWFDLSGKRSVVGAGASSSEPARDGGGDAAAAAVGAEADSKEEPGPKAEEEGPGSHESSSAPVAEGKGFTFAIRPTIRNHSNLKRDVVINTIAALVNDDRHKVNLSSPDKVILVDVYQTVCGMSVVDGDWEELKRFNLTELYSQARAATQSQDS